MLELGKSDKLAGAREKIALAKKMQRSGYFEDERRGGGRGDMAYPSQTIVITIIFAFAVILAFLLTGGTSNPLSGMHFTGIPAIDNFMTGSDIVHFTDDPDQNKVITIFGRGAAYFCLAGLLPAIAFILERLLFRKRIPPLVICWGVILLLMIMYLFVPLNSIIPFFRSL